MTFCRRLSISALLLCLPLCLQAQSKSTVAVLDFQPRGISLLEAQSLTDRFATSIGNTEEVILVERNAMDEILEEQGFQQSGCTTNECAVEVGKLLGVQFMVSGAIGKLGDTYTIDLKMFSVTTGAAENMQNVTYQGKVDGLIVEIETLAWTILGLDPPKELEKKRRQFAGGTFAAEEKGGSNWLLWTVLGLAAAGGGAYVLLGSTAAVADVPEVGNPPDFPTVP